MSTIDSVAGSIRQQLAQEGVAFSGAIASAARRHGLDPELLAAVAAQETGGPGSNAGANIVGDAGHGHGVFQIDDRSHSFADTAAAMDPVKNADYAANMLSGLLKQYGGDVHKALSAYNSGNPNSTGTLTKWADGKTLSYADSVIRHYKTLGAHRSHLQRSAAQPAAAAQSNPFSTISPTDQQQLIGEIFASIQELNSLQSFAQASPLDAKSLSTSAQPFTPASYSQLMGIDRTGHSKNDISWAGVIDAPDDSN